MRIKKFTQRLILLMGIFQLLFSLASNAQRGWGRHGRHGYYRGSWTHSYYHPYISAGFRTGYYRHYGGYSYHPHFFRPYFPHFGFRVSLLPLGYRRLYVGSSPYYYYGGVYYAPLSHRGYEVVEPPVGARISELPGDAQTVIIDGQQYYVIDGTYYREVITSDNRIEYEVVRTDNKLREGKSQEYSNTPDNSRQQVGNRITKLPSNSRGVTIKGKKYYESPDGTYYEEIISPNKVEYEVVGIPE